MAEGDTGGESYRPMGRRRVAISVAALCAAICSCSKPVQELPISGWGVIVVGLESDGDLQLTSVTWRLRKSECLAAHEETLPDWSSQLCSKEKYPDAADCELDSIVEMGDQLSFSFSVIGEYAGQYFVMGPFPFEVPDLDCEPEVMLEGFTAVVDGDAVSVVMTPPVPLVAGDPALFL